MEQLVKEAITGNKEAFEQIIGIEKPRLYAKALSYVGDKEDALDIVQETCMKAYKAIHQLQEPKYFSTWLFKLLIHESYATLRLRKRTLTIKAELIQQQLTEQESEPTANDLVHEALSYIRDEYRTTLFLFYFYDFSIKQISHMLDKPLNTIKMYLYRGRQALKLHLEKGMKKPIQKDVVIQMLKEELAKLALNFVSIPEDFNMIIENYGEQEASFIWAADDLDEGISITLDSKGKLLDLSTSIVVSSGIVLSIDDKKRIAEQFLREQHQEALAYLTFSHSKEKEESTRFDYEQFVGGYPLQSHNCAIEVSHAGEVVKFHYNGYATKLPALSKSIIEKEKVIEQNLHTTNWHLKLSYLSDATYEIEKSGLYMIYESVAFFNSYDACTGEASFKTDIEESDVSYESFPIIGSVIKYDTIEEIVGIPNTMELLRKVEDEDEVGMVWREKDWQSTKDLSFNSFLSNRTEDTVKAKVDKETKRVKEFIWFKNRTGTLQLSYGECREIARTFIGDYFAEYIPYLQMEMKEESFNEAQKAFFTFPLHDGNGVRIEGEHFYVSVNRTTGFIDLLMGPKISLDLIKQFQSQPILPIEQLSDSFKEIDAILKWSREYDKEEPYEQLKYELGHRESKKKIVGVNAYTGEVIRYKI